MAYDIVLRSLPSERVGTVLVCRKKKLHLSSKAKWRMMICCEGKYASLYSQERVKLAHLGLFLSTSTGYYMTFHQLPNPACHIPHWENAGE